MKPRSGVGKGVSPEALRHGLRVATWVYLAGPVALFLVGWLRAPLGALAAGALAVAVVLELRRPRPACRPEAGGAVPVWGLVAATLPALFVVALTGIGGMGVGQWDVPKHNAILADLVDQPWPVTWELEGERVALVYNVAYYLPAALVGKAAGWAAANVAIFVWTSLGAILTVGWLALLAGGWPLLCGLAFATFGGMEVLSWIGGRDGFGVVREAWSGHKFLILMNWFYYPSTVSSFVGAPQHALGGWLSTALVLSAASTRDARFPAALLVACSALWSPFAALGVAVLAWVPVAAGAPSARAAFRLQASRVNSIGIAIGVVLGLYYLAHWAPYVLPQADLENLAGRPNGILPLALDFGPQQWRRFLWMWPYFCVLEFGFLTAAVVFARGGWSARRGEDLALVAAAGTLLVLPWFRYGHWNDLAMRASIPGLFVLLALALRALRGARAKPLGAALVAATLLVGSETSLVLLRKQLDRLAERGRWVQIPRREEVSDLFTQHRGLQMRGKGFAMEMQYIGAADAAFFRWLAPPAAAREVPTSRGEGSPR